MAGALMERGNFTIDGSLVPDDVDPNDWDADAYERAVSADLDAIESTVVGRILFGFLSGHVLITPYETRWQWTNAVALRGPEPDWIHQGLQPNSVRGHGVSFVHVRFTPAMFVPAGTSNLRSYPGLHPVSSDEVLFHELFHALEQMWGTLNGYEIGATADDTVPISEQRAVRVANMFHSERGRPLRGPYRDTARLSSSGAEASSIGLGRALDGSGFIGFRGLVPMLRIPASPYHDTVVWLERHMAAWFMNDLPTLSWVLENVPRTVCEYNPFADYHENVYDIVYLPERWLPPVTPPWGPDPWRFIA